MAWQLKFINDGGPQHVLFHPESWTKNPARWRKDGLIAAEDLWFDNSAIVRGERAPPSQIPKSLRLWTKHKRLQPMFSMQATGITGVTEVGKQFLEQEAPGQCEFNRIEIFPRKGDAPLDGPFYWLTLLRRCGAIDWVKSNSGQGLVLRKSDIGDARIWHEHQNGSNWGHQIFVADSVKEGIEKRRIGRFEYVKAIEE